MARTNYSYEKRQRELAKKKKKEDKKLQKERAKAIASGAETEQPADDEAPAS